MECGEHAAAVGIEPVVALGIADIADGVAGDGFHIHADVGTHLTHHHHHTGGAETLAGHLGFGVSGQECIQDGVAYLVRNFVGMSFRHRFRRKEIILSHNIKKLAPAIYAMREAKIQNTDMKAF